MDQVEKKRPGRPRKHTEAGGRSSHSVWLTDATRAKVIAEAERKQISMSEDMGARIELSFLYEQFLGNLAGEGRAARMFRAFQKVVERVLRMSLTVPPDDRGTPMHFEIRTRKEIQAAIAVVSHVFAATEERRPVDPERVGLDRLPWGEGDRGRRIAYEWLWWDAGNYSEVDTARTTCIDAYWTGNGEELGNLDLSKEEVAWRRNQGAPPDLTLAEIFADEGGDRDRNASSPSRLSDSGPDEGDELPLDLPAEKPKRGRTAKPKVAE